jgi:hypothetical protein
MNKDELYEQRFAEIEELEKAFPQATNIQLFCKITEYKITLEKSNYYRGKAKKSINTSRTCYINAIAHIHMDKVSVHVCIQNTQDKQWTSEMLDHLILSGNIVVVKSSIYSINENRFHLIDADVVKVLDKEFDHVFDLCIECM